MIISRCSRLPACCQGFRCCPLLSIGRIVILLAIFVYAVVLVLRGYSPGAITGPVLVLVAVAVAAADQLVGVQRVRPVSALPTP